MKLERRTFPSLALVPAFVASFSLLTGSASAVVYFVRDIPVGGVGTTWATAFNSVSVALAAAVPGDEIRVAAGTYEPGAARVNSFFVTGVTLLGGFPAGGGPMALRDPVLNVTVLSGDIGVVGDPTDNSYHVVVAQDCTIDGFVIESGNANGPAPNYILGGGVYATGTVTLSHCKVAANKAVSGGGICYTTNQAGNHLAVRVCTIISNDALGNAALGYGLGGGLLAVSQEYIGRVEVDRSSFLGNTATASGGGAHVAMEQEFTNTVFSGNVAVGPGGGLFAFAPSIAQGLVANCTFANNDSSYLLGAGGAFLDHIPLVNSILWSNTAALGGAALLDQQLLAFLSSVDFCDTQGAVFVPGVGNRSVNPLFVNALGSDAMAGTMDDNLRLAVLSSCRDAGDNARAALPFDRDGRNRIMQSKIMGGVIVDLGAYEHTIMGMPARPGS